MSAARVEPARAPMPRWERQAWLVLLLFATALRLFKLGDRAFHHDESIHANFAMQLAHQGAYKYDPVYHGPIQYFAVASSFRFLGDSDFTARFPAALGGVALCAMALLLRPRYGPLVALVSGAFLAISPTFLYYTRFCREDVWSLLGTAGTFLFFDSYLRSRRIRDLALAAFAAAVAFAAKENFYVLCALMVPSVAAVWLEPSTGHDAWNRVRRLIDFLEEHQAALAGAVCLFFVLSELFYTLFLIRPESGNPAFDAISYWYGQHKIERVGGPKTYYLPRLLQYEFLILIPALILVFTRWRKFGAAERFLAAWGITSLLMYGYLGEKTPWLMVHQVLPFVPLAAIAWVDWCAARPRVQVVGAAFVLASFVTALSLSFWLPTITPVSRKAESAVYVQTCPEFVGLADEINAFARVGAVPAAIVAGEAGWPMTWYVRKSAVNWEMPKPDLKPPIVICDQGQADEAARILGPGYTKTEVPFRGWWLPETSVSPLHPNFSELVKYAFTREVWQGEQSKDVNPIGAVYVAVFRKTPGAAPAPAPAPAAPAAVAPAAQPPASP